jgi:predicted RNA methylase
MMVVILVLEMSEKKLLLRWLAGVWVKPWPRVRAAGHNRGTGINALFEKLLGPAFVVAVDVDNKADDKPKVKVNHGVFVHAHAG